MTAAIPTHLSAQDYKACNDEAWYEVQIELAHDHPETYMATPEQRADVEHAKKALQPSRLNATKIIRTLTQTHTKICHSKTSATKSKWIVLLRRPMNLVLGPKHSSIFIREGSNINGKILLLFVAVAATACSPSPDEQFSQRVEQDVRQQTNDPSAVKFERISAFRNLHCATGKLLAKNLFGAYTGYHDFSWVDGQVYLDGGSDTDSSIATIKAATKCMARQANDAKATLEKMGITPPKVSFNSQSMS